MELAVLGSLQLDIEFVWRFLSIIAIDLILAGDNAVIIAMAVRSLPQNKRKRVIYLGAGAAVILRVVLTFLVSQLLLVSFLKLVGGIVIFWIAVKLFMAGIPDDHSTREASGVAQAVKMIVIADVTMSIDNMLAVGAASGGSLFLLIFGLGFSIPFIVFTSSLLTLLMDKYPVIIYGGAAILGKVGGEMIITDPYIVSTFNPTSIVQYAVEVGSAAGVIAAGKFFMNWTLGPEKNMRT